jgi:hypothetical protein
MLKDLIQKLIVVLSLGYLVFFSAGVISPGVIASAFNINILLFVVLLLIFVLVVLGRDDGSGDAYGADGGNKVRLLWGGRYFLLLGIFLLFINIIALYKVSVVMALVYTVIGVIAVKLLWNNR